MLDQDAIADIAGDADFLYRHHGIEPGASSALRRLCVAMTGHPPEFARIFSEASLSRVAGSLRVFVRHGTPIPRARWLIGHELAEAWHAERRYEEQDIEARCDAMGAALAAPRASYLEARALHGDNVRAIAKALAITESTAILRDGETRGRPVGVVRRSGAIVRGDAFVWPVQLELPLVERTRHRSVKRIKIRDEPGRVGVRAALPVRALLPARDPKRCSRHLKTAPAAERIVLRDVRRALLATVPLVDHREHDRERT